MSGRGSVSGMSSKESFIGTLPAGWAGLGACLTERSGCFGGAGSATKGGGCVGDGEEKISSMLPVEGFFVMGECAGAALWVKGGLAGDLGGGLAGVENISFSGSSKMESITFFVIMSFFTDVGREINEPCFVLGSGFAASFAWSTAACCVGAGWAGWVAAGWRTACGCCACAAGGCPAAGWTTGCGFAIASIID